MPDDPALRDGLSIDRTVLANERTLLSYLRTTLAFVAAGGTILRFLDEWWAVPLGLGLIATGAALLGVGVWRFRRTRRVLRQTRAERVDDE